MKALQTDQKEYKQTYREQRAKVRKFTSHKKRCAQEKTISKMEDLYKKQRNNFIEKPGQIRHYLSKRKIENRKKIEINGEIIY